MARYKTYDYAQTVMVAVSLEEQLEPGTLEHTSAFVTVARGDSEARVLELFGQPKTVKGGT